MSGKKDKKTNREYDDVFKAISNIDKKVDKLREDIENGRRKERGKRTRRAVS